MVGGFQDLLSPLELIEPMGLASDFNLLWADPVVRCNKGIVCKVGEADP